MKTSFYPFMLEREMGIWEHQVDYNLSESGVHPMSVGELLGDDPRLISIDTWLNRPRSRSPHKSGADPHSRSRPKGHN